MSKNEPLDLAIVYFSHDGITSLYCGVGTSGRDICYSMLEISQLLEKRNIKLTFYPGTIRYSRSFHGYSSGVRKEVEEITKCFDTNIIEVENGSDGTLSYGNVDYWQTASQNAAKEIDQIARRHSLVIALSSDTPFAGVARFSKADNVKHIWIPRSTAKIHASFKLRKEDGSMDDFMGKRINWEMQAIRTANKTPKAYVGYIGNFVKEHLIKEYGTQNKALIETRIGLYLPRLEKYRTPQHVIESYLIKNEIPINKKLLVSFARAEYYKGLDLVLKLGGYLKEQTDIQTVILAVPYSMDDPYISELRDIRKQYNPEAILRFGHDFITPHYLMQWKNTAIVSVLSRQEPTGLVPNEFRFYKNSAAQLLVSNKDGLPERVNSGIDGFVCDIDKFSDVVQKATTILNLSEEEKRKICSAGYETIQKRYYLPVNIYEAIYAIIEYEC